MDHINHSVNLPSSFPQKKIAFMLLTLLMTLVMMLPPVTAHGTASISLEWDIPSGENPELLGVYEGTTVGLDLTARSTAHQSDIIVTLVDEATGETVRELWRREGYQAPLQNPPLRRDISLSTEGLAEGFYTVWAQLRGEHGRVDSRRIYVFVNAIPSVSITGLTEVEEGEDIRVLVLAVDEESELADRTLEGQRRRENCLFGCWEPIDEIPLDGVGWSGEGSWTGALTIFPGFNFVTHPARERELQFRFRAFDGRDYSEWTRTTITVNDINRVPVAESDTVITNEDTAVDITLQATDPDEEDRLSYSIVTQPEHGSLLGSGRNRRYVPEENYNGVDSFIFSAADNRGAPSTGRIQITVVPMPDAPIARDDRATTEEDTAARIFPLVNDEDPDGDALRIINSDSRSSERGSISCDASSCGYTPAADFNGEDSFTYTITDASGRTATATVRITVTPINDAPQAVDDQFETAEDTAITIFPLENDEDADNDLLTLRTFDMFSANGGSVSCSADGNCTYTPAADWFGTDTFTYTAHDGTEESNRATVTIIVAPVNDAPVANDDAVISDGSRFNVLTNDTDVDTPHDDLFIASYDERSAEGGSVRCALSGRCEYSPPAGSGFTGDDTFEYMISDGEQTSNRAMVTITVPFRDEDSDGVHDDFDLCPGTPVGEAVDEDGCSASQLDSDSDGINDAADNCPLTPNADQADTDSDGLGDACDADDDNDGIEDSLDNCPLTANPGQEDADGDGLGDVCDDDDDNDGVEDTLDRCQGFDDAVDVDRDGIPDGCDDFIDSDNDGVEDDADVCPGFDDTVDTDGDGIPDGCDDDDNDGPLGDEDDDGVINQDDLCPSTPAGEMVDEDGCSASQLDSDSDGINDAADNCPLTPNADQADTDSDGLGDACDADDDNDGVEDSLDNCPLTANPGQEDADGDGLGDVCDDDDDNDGVEDSLDNCPLAANSGQEDSDGDGIGDACDTDNTDGPLGDEDSDGVLNRDDLCPGTPLGTIVDRTGCPVVGEPPVARDDAGTVVEDGTVTISILANDDDPDGTLDPATVWIVDSADNGAMMIDPLTGDITYTPAPNFNGDDLFTYTVDDNEGNTSNVATVMIIVTSMPDPPVAVDDNSSTQEDTPLTIDVLANDFDVDNDPFAVDISDAVSTQGSSVLCTPSDCTYTPPLDFAGEDTFAYSIIDSTGLSSGPAIVRIIVTEVNDLPTAEDQDVEVPEDSAAFPITLRGDDQDGIVTDFIVVEAPVQGSLSLDGLTGEAAYTPNLNYNGLDRFTFRVIDDDLGESTIATVAITVLPINDPPILQPIGNRAANEDELLEVTITATDIENDPLTFSAEGSPLEGLGASFIDNGDGTATFAWRPSFDQEGPYTVLFTVADDSGAEDSETITITVGGTNRAPVLDLVSDRFVEEDTLLEFTITATDPDGDVLIFSAEDVPAGATFDRITQQFSWVPTNDDLGEHRVTFRVFDGLALDEETITITVSPVNDAPHAFDQTVSVEEDSVDNRITLTGEDEDGDLLTFSLETGPRNGSIPLFNEETGEVRYTPRPDFSGQDSFTFTVRDGTTRSAPATLTIIVDDLADAPRVQDLEISTVENEPVDFTLPASDADPGDILTFEIVSAPAHGTVHDFNPATGEATYQPERNFAGVDRFTFRVTDSAGIRSTIGVVRITIVELERDVQIMRARIANEILSAGEPVHLSISTSNNGNVRMDNMRVTATIPELATRVSSREYSLQPGERRNLNLNLPLPLAASPGRYLIRLTVRSDSFHETAYREITVR